MVISGGLFLDYVQGRLALQPWLQIDVTFVNQPLLRRPRSHPGAVVDIDCRIGMSHHGRHHVREFGLIAQGMPGGEASLRNIYWYSSLPSRKEAYVR